MLCVFYIYRGRRRGIRHQVTFPKGREGVLDTNYVWKRVALLSQVFCQHSLAQLEIESANSFFVAKIDMQNLNKCSFEDFRKVLLHYEL